MKRFLCLILVLCCVAAFPLTASAASPEENTEIIYNADGSYIVVTWEDVPARAAGSITKSKNRYLCKRFGKQTANLLYLQSRLLILLFGVITHFQDCFLIIQISRLRK